MGTVRYAMMMSLDGFIEDANRTLDWVIVDEEVHGFANALAGETEVSIYGRRLWDVMYPYWQEAEDSPESLEVEREFSRIWKRFRKIVVSRSLPATEPYAELWRELDLDRLRMLKQETTGVIEVGGPEVAGQVFAAGLVDEVGVFLNPVVLGAGTPMFPSGTSFRGQLVRRTQFASGVEFLLYRRT